MRRNTKRKLLAIYALVGVVGASLVAVPPLARAETLGVEIKTEGMVCSQCAYGLGKILKKRHGATNFDFDPKLTFVTFKPKDPTRPIAWDKLKKDMYGAGFTPKEIEITARGTFAWHEDHPEFTVSGVRPEQTYLVIPGELAGETRDGQEVVVTGIVKKVTQEEFPEVHQGHHPYVLELVKVDTSGG